MVLNNYRTILIGHYLVKLYGSIPEPEEFVGRVEWLFLSWAVRLLKGVDNAKLHVNLRTLIREGRSHKEDLLLPSTLYLVLCLMGSTIQILLYADDIVRSLTLQMDYQDSKTL